MPNYLDALEWQRDVIRIHPLGVRVLPPEHIEQVYIPDVLLVASAYSGWTNSAAARGTL